MVEALVEQAAWLTPTSLFLLLNFVIATILLSSAFSNNHKNHHSSATTTTASQPPPQEQQQQIARTPSLFSRVTSFNFNNYYPYNNTYHEQHQHQHGLHGPSPTPSLFSRVASFNFLARAHDGEEPEQEPEPAAPARDLGQSRAMRETECNNRSAVVTPAATAVAVARAPSLLSRVASFTLGRTPQQVEVDDDVDARRSNIVLNQYKLGNNNKKEEENNKAAVKKKKKEKGAAAKETTVVKRVEDGGHREVEVDAKADDFINRFKQQLKLQRIESLMRYRSA